MARPAKPMTSAESSEDLLRDGALSPDGAAEFTSLSRDEVDRAIDRGEIEIFKFGRRVLIPKRELVRWLAEKRDAYKAARKTH
jgi:excisionase family DNA binding protein